MTDAQHRAMGALLGYPSCCVEAWIALGERAPDAFAHVGHRLPGFADSIRAAAVAAGLDSGWPDRACTGDPRICFAPCEDCRQSLDKSLLS